MNNLQKYILPIPYSPYDKYEQRIGFEEYKERIYGWVNKDTIKLNKEQKLQRLERYFECLHDSQDKYTSIYMLLIENIDKVEFLPDFSGVSFGITIDERFEQIYVNCAHLEYKELLPNFDVEQFKSMQIYKQVEWILENSEFLPIRCFYENIDTFYHINHDSHMFSHIKKNEKVMEKLERYLEGRKYKPSDKAYYFIDYNPKTRSCFLIRDLVMSPRK